MRRYGHPRSQRRGLRRDRRAGRGRLAAARRRCRARHGTGRPGRELGLPGLVADVLADNYFILPLLARVGAIATTFAYSGYSVRVGFGIPLSGGAMRSDIAVRG